MLETQEQHLVLRLFRPDDLDAVQELIFRTIDACYTGVYPSQAVAFFKEYHSEDNILEDSEQGHTFVLEVDRRIVGSLSHLDQMLEEGTNRDQAASDGARRQPRAPQLAQMLGHRVLVDGAGAELLLRQGPGHT